MCLRFIEKAEKYEFVVPDDSLSEPPDAVSIDERIDLYQALNTLHPEEKTLIILKYFEDRSFREIAETMNCRKAL
ncbi:MAG: RNA polymerase sigma factor [Eisenbergiella massiliensis]